MGEPSPDFAQSIAETHEVRSLWAEHEIASVLTGLGWRARQGLIYRDPTTGKARELDVFAERCFWSDPADRGFRLGLVVAAKSLAEQSFVVLPEKGDTTLSMVRLRHGPLISSVGWMNVEFAVVSANLEQIRRIAAVPESRRIEIHRAPILPTGRCFREVRPKAKEREIDETIVFRTRESLDAAVSAITSDRVEQAKELVQGLSRSEGSAQVRGDRIGAACARIARTDFAFHTTIIADGRILAIEGRDRLVPLPAVRLGERGLSGTTAWTDVVATASATEYFSTLTNGYDVALAELGFAPCDEAKTRVASVEDSEVAQLPLSRFA